MSACLENIQNRFVKKKLNKSTGKMFGFENPFLSALRDKGRLSSNVTGSYFGFVYRVL